MQDLISGPFDHDLSPRQFLTDWANQASLRVTFYNFNFCESDGWEVATQCSFNFCLWVKLNIFSYVYGVCVYVYMCVYVFMFFCLCFRLKLLVFSFNFKSSLYIMNTVSLSVIWCKYFLSFYLSPSVNNGFFFFLPCRLLLKIFM